MLEQLETLEGNELHLLRIRLSEAIKRVITKIVTYPGGRWYTEEEIENYRRDLVASDEYDADTINAVGGGLLRDVLVREEPLLFKPGQFCALIVLGGCGLFALLRIQFRMEAMPASWSFSTTGTWRM